MLEARRKRTALLFEMGLMSEWLASEREFRDAVTVIDIVGFSTACRYSPSLGTL